MQAQDASILDINLPNPEENPKGTVKSLSWAPNASSPTFVTSDLASQIRIFNLNPGSSILAQKACLNTESPCLSVGWCGDETRVIGGGLDHSVKLFDLATGKSDIIGYHEEPVKSVYWLGSTNQILSLSLDKTVRLWDPRQKESTACYTLDHQVYCSDLLYPYLGIAMSEQKVMLLNIEEIQTAIGTEHARQKNCMESNLDPNREISSIKVFGGDDDLGLAVGGIDGRCNISKVYEPEKTLAKLVHVLTWKTDRREMDGSEPPPYPVNCIGFHPHMGKDFCYTGRGDGKMHFWDIKKKDKIAEFNLGGVPVTQAEIDPTGKFLAYSLGGDSNEEGVEKRAKVYVHVLQDRELRHQAVVEEKYPIKYP